MDIAGLVAGASKGEGLGNKFLANIRETHAIAHVVRCFENDDVVHVAGRIDPMHDIEIINTELLLADLAGVEKAADKAEKQARAGKRTISPGATCSRNSAVIWIPGSPPVPFRCQRNTGRLWRRCFCSPPSPLCM